MILLSEMKIRKFFLPNWSWARQPLSSARSTLLYPFQMLNAKQGSSNSHLLTSFGMTRPGIEPTTSRLWGGRSTDWANTIRYKHSSSSISKPTHQVDPPRWLWDAWSPPAGAVSSWIHPAEPRWWSWSHHLSSTGSCWASQLLFLHSWWCLVRK